MASQTGSARVWVTFDEETGFELDTRYAKASLRFDVRVESGRNVVFVSEVAIGSPAYEEGIRAGMVLREISDPIRYSEVWELDDYCSLRYVRDAFRMRRSPTIFFGFIDPVPSQQQTGRNSEALSGAVKEEQPKSSESSKSSSSDASSLRKTLESMDEMLGTDFVQDAGGNAGSGAAASAAAAAAASAAQQQSAAGSGDTGGPERQGNNIEAFARELSKSSKRIKRRKEYLNVVSERDDSRFFAIVTACFFLPALIGLAAAQFSGYLDFLATRY